MGEHTTYTGTISVSARGVGYFTIPEFEEDIEIQTPFLRTALHNDEVEVALLAEKQGERRQGEVIKIIKRAKEQFVGTLESNNGNDFFFLKPDDRRMYRDLFIHSSKAMRAKSGDKVLAKITGWKDPMKSPEGQVLRVLGRKGIHEVEMQAIVLEKGFDTKFPPEVESEAQKVKDEQLSKKEAEIAKRRDFRQTLTFTIDPIDAKDFDDAISFKDLGNRKYEIGIHIADVSHFVTEGTELDKEARKRGTSVYLVDRTIPMLPEILSNDLCSLNANEDKFTFSAVFTMDDGGKVSDKWFGKTVIHSDKRFTYEEAQDILDKKTGLHFNELDTLNKIAKVLQKKKFENGAIEFETDEIKFELDPDGKPIRVFRKVRKDIHKLVEEFMLLANQEVATYMNKETGAKELKTPFIYRIHDVPDKDKIANLKIFLKSLGYDLKSSHGEITATEINRLLKEVTGKPEESLVKTATIRAMSKAIYSTKNIGHFGLGFEFYTHFTSPIRRYPDMLVHRLLFRLLSKGKVGQDELVNLERLAENATDKEISAAEAERSSIKYKQVEYMLDKVGQEFNATISGVSEWGIYVEEDSIKAEGMVRMRDMTDDFYSLDEKNYCIVGKDTKKKYTLGDRVNVKLKSADLDKKTLDFILI
ncbi:MAG: ribonuclease R [Candidatus Zambryskibacteria bacterium RIFCSPLOWO2_01_FULL_43_17]|uniref:Ribonuclease R n=1 Tax=Candidatus Zambryskibacteria bacterium RIFCSPLOWO2_01_FULL_43_17 TaxID=1802760 RepID=A0A1G2U5M8_9BACT|nr:MAG: ribonuclease R [Candidatus Zambryskibacteria bacterium RIFCSPLOWO2_01_FULL_43_17]